MTTTTTPAVDVDVWGHTQVLRDAEAAVDAATASGDVDQIAGAVHVLIVTAAAHAWPTATALVFTYETTGPVAHLWGLWRVVDVDGRVLREWETKPGDMTDESEERAIRARLDWVRRRSGPVGVDGYASEALRAVSVDDPRRPSCPSRSNCISSSPRGLLAMLSRRC